MKFVSVPLRTEEFVWFDTPSITIEQLSVGERLSVKLNVNVTLVELIEALLDGNTRLIIEPDVSIVKFLVSLLFVLPDVSVQLMLQLCKPSVKPPTVKFVSVPLRTEELVWFDTPSMNIEQLEVGDWLSVKLNVKLRVLVFKVLLAPG